MTIYPAIDLKGGRVVRLEQGRADRETVYFEDPAEPAGLWKAAGAEWIHVVDLDGAFTGQPANADAVRKIADTGLKIELGGGIRSLEIAKAALEAGATRIVIGTKAVENLDFVDELISELGAEHVAVGIDAKDGYVAVKGWVETGKIKATDLAKEVAKRGVKTVIYTDIARDGMLVGPNMEAQEEMLALGVCDVIASGGVSSNADIESLRELSRRYSNLDGVIVGKALYEGRVRLEEVV